MSLRFFKKQISAILMIIGFAAWIIPLGAFVEAHQEGLICNGRRMVCLCTNRHEQHDNHVVPSTYRRPSGSSQASLSFPSFGGVMDNPKFYMWTFKFESTADFPIVDNMYLNPSLSMQDPVPKAA